MELRRDRADDAAADRVVADQITRERVGVAGIAVFRIAEPMLAFRVMDFMQADAPIDWARRCAGCSSAFAQLLALAKSFGLELDGG